MSGLLLCGKCGARMRSQVGPKFIRKDRTGGRRTPQLKVYSRGRYTAMTGTVDQPGGLHPLVVP